MDITDYIRLLSAVSVDNTSKFIHVDDKRPAGDHLNTTTRTFRYNTRSDESLALSSCDLFGTEYCGILYNA